MKTNRKNVIGFLDGRIALCRWCMAGILILGLLAGVCILCGRSPLVSPGFSGHYQICLNLVFCFSIAVTGITTGAAFRYRIRKLTERRNRIWMYSDNGSSFPEPVRDQIVVEVQALFGILFVLGAAICCVGYPIPKIPAFLDTVPLRLVPILGFAISCWVAIRAGRKNSAGVRNPLQGFVETRRTQAFLQVSLVPVRDAHERDIPGPQTNRAAPL